MSAISQMPSFRSTMIPGTAQVVKTTIRVLTISCICELLIFLTGISFLCYGAWGEVSQDQKFMLVCYGKNVATFGFLSGTSNLLARLGVRIWSRVLLVPYIIFLTLSFAYVLVTLTQTVGYRGVKQVDFIFFLTLLVILYIWQTMLKQWIYMSLAKPSPIDSEAPVVSPVSSSTSDSRGQAGQVESPPPKYDSIEEDANLPNYAEAVGRQQVNN